jgi:hypothetical protein
LSFASIVQVSFPSESVNKVGILLNVYCSVWSFCWQGLWDLVIVLNPISRISGQLQTDHDCPLSRYS